MQDEETRLDYLPVKRGQEMIVVPVDRARKDYFIKINGYIVFLKDVTDEMKNTRVKVRVFTVKENYALARYFGRP